MGGLDELQASDPVETVRDWITNFLGRPHEDLGRPGAVCPFVTPAIAENMLKITSSDIEPDADALHSLLQERKAKFIATQSGCDSSNLIYASHVIVLPKYKTSEHTKIMDEVQASLKIEFMNEGLMIGQFHPHLNTPGLHSAAFLPHRCPTSCFGIRHMIPSDHVFISQHLPPDKIPDAAAALLQRFRSALPSEVIRRYETNNQSDSSLE